MTSDQRRPVWARNEGSTGPKRLDDTRFTTFKRRINYRTQALAYPGETVYEFSCRCEKAIFAALTYFPSEAQAFYTCHDVVCFYYLPGLFGRLLGVSLGSACNLKLKRCGLNV